jgi:hypothetical protein
LTPGDSGAGGVSRKYAENGLRAADGAAASGTSAS